MLGRSCSEVYLLTKERGAIYRLAASAVPEPATWLMLLLGFALVATSVRRGKSRGSACGA